MLAYIFWHWPLPTVDAGAYERMEVAFQRALVETAPPGLLESAVFRSASVPWLATGGEVYQDWALLEDSSALDRLNNQAVTGPCQELHGHLSRAVAGSAGSLYYWRKGEAQVSGCRAAAWLSKPRGMSYDEFFALLKPLTDQPAVSLWRRQMVLGPSPEFGLLSPGRLSLPSGLDALELTLDVVWSSEQSSQWGLRQGHPAR
jgi:hypothetical protein